MKHLFLFFICYMFSSSFLFPQGGWFWGRYTLLSDVYFINHNDGWVVGMDGLILNTTDGGTSWAKQQSGTSYWLTSVFFIDNNTGFTVGSSGTILKTTDGGISWTQKNSGTSNTLYDVSFIDFNIGIAAGSNGAILKTTNGGTDWIKLESGSSSDFDAIFMVDKNNVYVVGSWGTIMKTSDGGSTWIVQLSGVYELLLDVFFTDLNYGYVVGGDGIFRKTTDGGINWILISTGNTNGYTSLFFTDRYNGIIVGNGGTVLKTTNGGLSWKIQTINPDLFFNSVYFTSSVSGIIVGNNGIILTTTDGGANWVKQTNGVTAPDLEWPSNNSSDLPTSVEFGWYDITLAADHYQLQIAKDSLFNIVVYDNNTILTEQYTVSGLPDSSLLFWRVRSYFSGSSKDWSNVWSFSTISKTPVLIKPINHSVLDPQNIRLQWSNAADVVQFRFQVSTDSLFTSNILDEEIGISFSKTISINYNSKYFWRVGAKNNNGQIYWTNFWDFTTFDYPQISFPLEIGNKWYYQRGTNTSECFAVIKEVTDTLSNGFREITNRYIYRNYESIGKEYWGFIDGKFYSNTSPQLENSKIFYNAFLNHDSCMGDINYSYCLKLIEFKIFNNIDTAQLYIRNWALASIVSGTERVITSPQVGIISTWAASYPRSGEGVRDSSHLIGLYRRGEFLGDSAFYNPYRASTPLSPWDGSRDMFLTVKLQWRIASEVVSYRLQVSKDYEFRNMLVDSIGLKDTFIVIGTLDSCTFYYWRIGTFSSDGNEYWSSIFSFKTFGCAENFYSPSVASLYQNYPNPFYPSTKIKYSLTTASADTSSVDRWSVQIKIFNILGEEIAEYNLEEQLDGIYDIEFIGRGLANGIYIYRLKVGNFFETKKMILLK